MLRGGDQPGGQRLQGCKVSVCVCTQSPTPQHNTQQPQQPQPPKNLLPFSPVPGLGDLLHGFPVELCFAVDLLDGLSGLRGLDSDFGLVISRMFEVCLHSVGLGIGM